MPAKRKPKWLKFMDRYESVLVLAILASMAIEIGIELAVFLK